jgi:transposase
MTPFDGSSKKSVLVMDNCAIHHVSPALKMLSDAGIIVPPYSPDLNPAEELFSYVKYYLKQHDKVLKTVCDPKPIIIDSVTTQDCLGWIRHSGY